jgi:hypothetical protein
MRSHLLAVKDREIWNEYIYMQQKTLTRMRLRTDTTSICIPSVEEIVALLKKVDRIKADSA